MVLRQAIVLAALGAAAGAVLAAMAAGLVEPLLFRTSPRDPSYSRPS